MLSDALTNTVKHLGMETAQVPRLLAGRSGTGRTGTLPAPLVERPVLTGVRATEADYRPHELAHDAAVFCEPSLTVTPLLSLIVNLGPRMRSMVTRYSCPACT